MKGALADGPERHAEVYRPQLVLLQERSPLQLLCGVVGKDIAQADRVGAGHGGLPAGIGRFDGVLQFRIVQSGVAKQHPQVEEVLHARVGHTQNGHGVQCGMSMSNTA